MNKKIANKSLQRTARGTALATAEFFVIMKTDYQNIFDRLHKIYRKYRKKYKNPDSNQVCCMWSTKNLPDEIYECSQIYDIDKEFNICLSEDDALAIYDMYLDEATKYIIKIINEK